MFMQLVAAIVRVFTSSGDVVGTGFCVDEVTVLTCAHVVAAALGIADTTTTMPETPISLDFPLVASGYKLTAQVVFWQSVQIDGGGDIAVLQLKGPLPVGTKVARLVIAGDLWDHTFRACGFPRSHDQGIWASGKLRAREATGWVQIEDIKVTGTRVQQGFSGGAVWDEQLDGVVGMVVAADEDASKIAYIIPSTVLVKAYPALGPQTIPPCPYRGLLAFREQDAPYFFGRETFTGDLLEAVRRKPLVAVVGPSGSGKSSIVFAGLLPRLRQEAGWIIASFRPGIHPFHSLAEALLDWLEPALSETDRLTEVSKLAQRLEQGELALQDVVERLLRQHSEAHLLLIADQFEELYTLCREQEVRQHFLDEVLALVQAASQASRLQCKVLLTLRADFLGQVLSYRPFADALQQADLKLGPMNRAELLDVIKKPAEKLQVKLEDGLAERILEAVSHEPGNLPLLEFALTQLWANQQAGQLTHEAYNEIGGVEQALTKYAEEVYQELSEEDRQRLERIFIQLVRPSEEIEDSRRIANSDEIGRDNWPLIVRLSSARLVVSGHDETTGEETVELIHEALIRGWERLHQWSEENREFRTWQEQLRAALRQWESSGQDKSALLRGTLLRKAESWLKQRPDAIAPAEQDFIRAGIELERKGRRNVVIGGLVGIAILATTGTSLALLIRPSSAQPTSPSPTASPNTQKVPLLVYTGHANAVNTAAWSRDGQRIASGSDDKDPRRRVLIWDATTRKTLLVYPHHTDEVKRVAWSPDGKRIASASYDKTAQIWDATTGKTLIVYRQHTDYVRDVAWSPDGRRVASASYDMTVRVWDATTGATILTYTGHFDWVFGVAWSPDGKLIASASRDTTVQVWDATNVAAAEQGNAVYTYHGHTSTVKHVAWSPDSRRIASASYDGTAQVWDATTGGDSRIYYGHSSDVYGVAWSPDGKWIASASADKTVQVWEVATGTTLRTYTGHTNTVNEVEWSPDGKYLVSASDDTTVMIWQAPPL